MDRRTEREKEYPFELKLANGRSRKFDSGDSMYVWAIQNIKNMDATNELSFSEWMERRNKR